MKPELAMSPNPPVPDALACWNAVLRKDRAANGSFVYAVRTTGVYCRPSCGARLPKRENVVFFATGVHAQQAGFRACMRCEPDAVHSGARHAHAVERVCRLIEASDQPMSLEHMALEANLSPHHFHRVFKALTGVTPKSYNDRVRSQRLRAALDRADRVTGAIYDAGFNSSSRFYERAQETLGMTPSQYRKGGEGLPIRTAHAQCSLGVVLVAATATGICAILLGDDAQALLQDLRMRFPHAQLLGTEPAFEQLVSRAIEAIEHPGTALELPLDIRGTAFQQRVWAALRGIPPGTTATYTEIAERLGTPKAVRAVAAACAANPIAVAVPCHRVVRRDGDLAGYRWGLERKRELLEREKPDE